MSRTLLSPCTTWLGFEEDELLLEFGFTSWIKSVTEGEKFNWSDRIICREHEEMLRCSKSKLSWLRIKIYVFTRVRNFGHRRVNAPSERTVGSALLLD